MSNLAQFVRSAADRLHDTLGYQPGVRTDISAADHATTAAVVFVAIGKGASTIEAIHRYLETRGSRLDRPTLQFILDVFNGRDRRHYLWTRDAAGRYALLT